jgi:tetratricopeptide (TPR) repeat protein
MIARSKWNAVTLLLVGLALLAGREARGADEPGAGAARLAAGDAAAAKLDLAGALAAYRDAHAAMPESYEAAWKLARTLTDKATLSHDGAEQKALYLEAEALARRAVQLDAAGTKGHDYLAIALGKLALYEGGKRKVELAREVKAEAEQALRLDPDDDLALHVRALWNREMASLGWALRSFAQLLYGKLPPASLDAALTDLTRAAELRPGVLPHHVELGVTLAAARRWAEASAELEKALALPTGWVTDDYYRARARTSLEQVRTHLK